MAERALLEGCVQGQIAAWEEFVRRYGGVIRHAAAEALKRARGKAEPADVQDVYQAVLLSLWRDNRRRLRSYQGRAPVGRWLAVIAARTALNHVRSESRKQGARFAELLPPPKEAPADLRELMRDLRPLHRAVLALRYLEDMTPNQIAEALGMNPNTVSSLITRATRTLAARSFRT